MLLRHRLALPGVALALVAGVVAAASPLAQAAGTPIPANTAAAQKAADWLAQQSPTSADAAISLAYEGHHADVARGIVAALTADVTNNVAGAYATKNCGATGKVIIAALAVGADPASFGGKDLYDVASKDASCATSYVMNPALAAIALSHGGKQVPTAWVDALVAPATLTQLKQYNDVDTAGVVLQALSSLTDPRAADATATTKAWLDSVKVDNTYWNTYSPVNTTAVVGGGMAAAGTDVASAVTWVASQQTAGGGLPSTLGGTEGNVMATEQGLMFLAGGSYVAAPAAVTTPSATPSGPASTSPSTPALLNERVSCADQGGVWTIIEVSPVVTHRGCVMNPATALDAARQLATVQTKSSSLGEFICSIDAQQDCDAPFSGSYWGLYTSAPGQPWGYATEGATTLKPTAGSYLALVWSDTAQPQQVRAGDGVVPLATPSPEPTTTPTPSSPKPSASPTSTGAPAPQLPRTGGR